jgi:hypothetical protein
MFRDEIVGSLKEWRGGDGCVTPFQVVDEAAHRILLLRRKRPDYIGKALIGHSVYPTAVYRARQVSSSAAKIRPRGSADRVGHFLAIERDASRRRTVVPTNAQVKIFLDADPDERVSRRCEEMRAKGGAVNATIVGGPDYDARRKAR